MAARKTGGKAKKAAFYAQSNKETWCTPASVLKPVKIFAGSEGIALDPAGHPMSAVNARQTFTGPRWGGVDGLLQPWHGYGLVWLNPPFGLRMPVWMQKVHDEAGLGAELLTLTPAATETGWCKTLAQRVTATCFWGERIGFEDRDYSRDSEGIESSSTFSAVVSYLGPRVELFLDVFGPYGWCLVPPKR